MSLTKKFVLFGQRYDNTEVDTEIARLKSLIEAKDTTIDNQLEAIDIKDMQIKDLTNENAALKNATAANELVKALTKELEKYKGVIAEIRTANKITSPKATYVQPFLYLNDDLNFEYQSDEMPIRQDQIDALYELYLENTTSVQRGENSYTLSDWCNDNGYPFKKMADAILDNTPYKKCK